jgi:hypothetical protein
MSLISAGQIKTRETGNSIERLSGDKVSLLNMLGDGGCSINDLPVAARLHGALSRDHTSKLGSLVAPSGRQTQSEGETLDFLMTTNFLNS